MPVLTGLPLALSLGLPPHEGPRLAPGKEYRLEPRHSRLQQRKIDVCDCTFTIYGVPLKPCRERHFDGFLVLKFSKIAVRRLCQLLCHIPMQKVSSPTIIPDYSGIAGVPVITKRARDIAKTLSVGSKPVRLGYADRLARTRLFCV